MKIAVIGTGIVGLTTGAGLADLGHSVLCVDIDTAKIARLSKGIVPYYESGLQELVTRNVSAGRLRFGNRPAVVMEDAELVIVAVGTPSDDHGEMVLTPLWSFIDKLEPWDSNETKMIAIKSTVPVGTTDRVEARLRARLPERCKVDVAFLPEFMREGSAVKDFFSPARTVIGAVSAETGARLELLHRRLPGTIVVTDRRSAELAKLASNAFLAVKISFANEMAALAEHTGANYPSVAELLGLDPRIGPLFLNAGLGFGGSCLPKDARALVRLADEAGAPQTLVSAAIRANVLLPMRMVRKLEAALSDPSRRKVALLGLAFKAGTDDMREAPSIRLAAELARRHPGIELTAYDPAVGDAAKRMLVGAVRLCASAEEALRGADAAIVVTEWREFRQIPAEHFKKWMNRPIIVDGRNALDGDALNAQGVVCIGVGRLPASSATAAEPIRRAGGLSALP